MPTMYDSSSESSPSPYDILGTLSFIQGVLTLIAAIFLAFNAFVSQLVESRERRYFLFRKLIMVSAAARELRDSPESMRLLYELDRHAEIVKSLLDDWLRRSWLQRLLHCGDISKRATELKAELDKIEQDIRFMKLTSRLEEILSLLHEQSITGSETNHLHLNDTTYLTSEDKDKSISSDRDTFSQ